MHETVQNAGQIALRTWSVVKLEANESCSVLLSTRNTSIQTATQANQRLCCAILTACVPPSSHLPDADLLAFSWSTLVYTGPGRSSGTLSCRRGTRRPQMSNTRPRLTVLWLRCGAIVSAIIWATKGSGLVFSAHRIGLRH